jgi:AcrR family transcriptional regulator
MEALSANCGADCPTCARLRTAMLHVAGTRGFEAADVVTLAAESGCSVQEVEVHAPSRDALLASVFDEIEPRIRAAFRRGFTAHRAWVPRFAAGAQSVLDLYQAEPWVARVAEVETRRAGPLSRAARHRGWRLWCGFVLGELARERDLSVPRTHVEVVGGAHTSLLFDRITTGRLAAPDMRRDMFELSASFDPVAA